MKLILNTLVLLCTSCVFAENLQVEITRKNPEHGGVHFSVVAEAEQLMHNQFQVSWVVVAVKPSDQSNAAQTAYLEVWDGDRFVYASALPACKPSDIPINLPKQISTDNAVLFAFKINPAFLKRTWFNYQIPRHSTQGEPTDCVIHLEEFIRKPNQAAQATARKLADPGR